MPSLVANSIADTSASPRQQADKSRLASVYEFEAYRLDAKNRLLTCGGKEILLPGRAFDVLLMLVRRPKALLTKQVLLASIWSGSFVEAANRTVAVSAVLFSKTVFRTCG